VLGRKLIIVVAVATTLATGDVPPATSQVPPPELHVVLVLEITDPQAWVALHEETLGAPSPGTKPLDVSVAATTGGRRSITLGEPRFDVAVVRGFPAFKVTVHGKIGVSEALLALGPFEQAVLDKQTTTGECEVWLLYVLSNVTARLLEMHVTQR
jgi:hypothetical protein